MSRAVGPALVSLTVLAACAGEVSVGPDPSLFDSSGACKVTCDNCMGALKSALVLASEEAMTVAAVRDGDGNVVVALSNGELRKLTPDGEVLWQRSYPDAHLVLGEMGGRVLALNVTGEIYLATAINPPSQWAGQSLPAGVDPYVTWPTIAKLSPEGDPIWMKVLSQKPSLGRANLVALPNGGVAIASDLPATVSVDGHSIEPAGLSDSYVMGFDAEGNYQYDVHLGAYTLGPDIGITLDGSIVVSTGYRKALNIQGHEIPPAGANSWLLLALTPNGAFEWAHTIGAVDSGIVLGVLRVTKDNHIVQAGYCEGPVDFGEGQSVTCEPSSIAVVVSTATGKALWAHAWAPQYATSADLMDIAVDDRGIVLFGSATSQIDFGGGPLQPDPLFGSSFLVRLDECGQHVHSAILPSYIELNPLLLPRSPAGSTLLYDFTDEVDVGSGALAPVSGHHGLLFATFDP